MGGTELIKIKIINTNTNDSILTQMSKFKNNTEL